MFRPIPEAPFFRRAPFRLIASIPFIVAAVNPTAEAVLKRPAAALLGDSYESVFPNGEIIREALHEALTNHRHMSQRDVPYEGPDGRPRTIRVGTVDLVGDDGQPAGVL